MEQADRDRLNAMAASQFGLVTRAQLLAHGMSDSGIAWKLTSSRWRQVHPGVYLTSPGRDDWVMRAMAAVLVSGTGAALGRASAGYTYGLVPQPPAVIEIFVPHGRTVRAPPGVRVGRCLALASRVDDGDLWIPRTRPADTVLDMAETGDADAAIAIVASSCRQGVTWEEGLRAALAARGRYRWRELLTDTLADVGSGAESVMEVRFVRDVERAHGLPVGVSQLSTRGGSRRHDRGYSEQRLLVELQGLALHGNARAIVRDGRRMRDSLREGWTTVPAFWPDVAVTPCDFAMELAALLTSLGWTGEIRRCRRRDCAVATASRRADPGG